MMLKPSVLALLCAGLVFGNLAQANPPAQGAKAAKPVPVSLAAAGVALDLDVLKKTLESKIPGLTVEAIRESDYPGLVEIVAEGRVLYVSPDGRYLFSGNMFDIDKGLNNLTEERMAELDQAMAPERAKDIAALGEKSMIIFKAPQEKYKITVFTDIDCGYCRKLHSQIGEYNRLGITVRYIGFPRAGIPSSSYDKLVAVWCADDPKAALTEAKHDGKLEMRTCPNPIEKHYALVKKFGLHGTPAIVLQDGTLIPGYVPPTELANELAKHFGKS